MENKNNDWITTTERYVGYIDIMGFKDMVARNSHEQIYEMMKKLDTKIKFNESMAWGGRDESLIRTTTYSDSIMIYRKTPLLSRYMHLFVQFHH